MFFAFVWMFTGGGAEGGRFEVLYTTVEFMRYDGSDRSDDRDNRIGEGGKF